MEGLVSGSDSFNPMRELQHELAKIKADLDKEKKKNAVLEKQYKKSLDDMHQRLMEKSLECETAADLINEMKDTTKELNMKVDSLKAERKELTMRCKTTSNEAETEEITKLKTEVAAEKEKVQQLTSQAEKNHSEFTEHCTKAERDIKRYQHDIKDRDNEIRDRDSQIKSLKTERDDLSTRYSQLASNQPKHINPDIVDLSEPNRAMKLADRYNDLYNDTWTDAFTEQTDLRIPDKAVIHNLLHVLNESFQFCKGLAHVQFESLSNLILHPCPAHQEDLRKPVKAGVGVNKPRLSSANDKALRDVRRQIMTQNVSEITQEFLSYMSKQIRTNEEKKCMDVSKAYYEKCAEISWLMVLHDPPLCMKADVKPGSRVDRNYFTVYSKGEKVDYLVWPALLNGDGKGLLTKGVVELVQKGRK